MWRVSNNCNVHFAATFTRRNRVVFYYKVISQGNKNISPHFQTCSESLFTLFISLKIVDFKYVL
jgi:hypothetical protein